MGFLDKAAKLEQTSTDMDELMVGSYTMKAGAWNDRYQSQMLSCTDVAYRLPEKKPSTNMIPSMPLSSQNKR